MGCPDTGLMFQVAVLVVNEALLRDGMQAVVESALKLECMPTPRLTLWMSSGYMLLWQISIE